MKCANCGKEITGAFSATPGARQAVCAPCLKTFGNTLAGSSFRETVRLDDPPKDADAPLKERELRS